MASSVYTVMSFFSPASFSVSTPKREKRREMEKKFFPFFFFLFLFLLTIFLPLFSLGAVPSTDWHTPRKRQHVVLLSCREHALRPCSTISLSLVFAPDAVKFVLSSLDVALLIPHGVQTFFKIAPES